MSYQLVINSCGMSHRNRGACTFLTISSAYLGQWSGMVLANDDNSYFEMRIVDKFPEGVNISEDEVAASPTLEFTHSLSSETHRALENEGRSTFRQVVFSGCLEENSEGLQRGLR